MRGRVFICGALLCVIGLVFLLCFTKQRKILAEIRDEISVADAGVVSPVKEKRAVISALVKKEQEAEAVAPGVDPSLVLPRAERIAFLKQMRSLIHQSDSGMTSFIPSKDYAQKIHSMNAETLKVLLVDLENFQVNWSSASMMKGNLLNSLVQLDPLYVLDVAHDGGNEKWGRPMMTAIRMIAADDPRVAIDWIERASWEDEEWKHKLTSIWAQSITGEDLPLALATVDSFQVYTDEFKDALRRIAIAAETTEQRRQIASYLDRVEDRETRDQTRATLVRGAFYREGFESATAMLAEYFDPADSAVRNEMIQEIAAESLREGQRDRIADWVLSESVEDERVSNIRELVGNWAKLDPDSAAAWIGDMDAGEERKAAIAVLAEEAKSSDEQSAAGWLREIAD